MSTKGQDSAYQKREILSRLPPGTDPESVLWFAEKESAIKRGLKRPELEKLAARVEAGEVAAVYVWALDRLSRSGIADTVRVVKQWRGHGCKIYSVKETFDINDPVCGELLVAVMSWAAEQETRRKSERIAAKRALMEAEGKDWGREPTFTADDVRRVRSLKAEGYSIRKIAERAGVKRSTVARILDDEASVGRVLKRDAK